MSDEGGTEKYTFRTGDLNKEELQEFAQEIDVSLADIMRQQASNLLELHENEEVEASPLEIMNSHAENMQEDEDYRDLHEAFYRDERDFRQFVTEEDVFDTKWVDETTVDYDLMLDKFRDIVYNAQMGDYEEARSIVDEFEEQGYSQEAFLFSSVISEYRE